MTEESNIYKMRLEDGTEIEVGVLCSFNLDENREYLAVTPIDGKNNIVLYRTEQIRGSGGIKLIQITDVDELYAAQMAFDAIITELEENDMTQI